MNKSEVLAMLDSPLSANLGVGTNVTNAMMMQSGTYAGDYTAANKTAFTTNATNLTGWTYWSDLYYPTVIKEAYPVYLQERAQDKGKQAFEIIKVLKDKKLVNLSKVGDFIDLMDELIKIL